MNFVCLSVLIVSLLGVTWSAVPPEPYQEDWYSLAKHNEAPEWFRDVKFGIYFHWGVYSVPAFDNEWYPRNMHFEDHPVYKHHLKTYGHPSEFGYHDFVPRFKAEYFDADAWAELFAQAGARFAGPVAEHHDGFAMWDSKVTPWNVVDMGPQRDITGELEKAIRARGMKFIATFHHAKHLQRYADQPDEQKRRSENEAIWQTNFELSQYPFIEGMPPASEDPQLRLLYGHMPEPEWLERFWLGKLKEVIDQYHPDLIWFDYVLDSIPEAFRQKYAAYYFNVALQNGQAVVTTHKGRDMPFECSVEDFEKGRLDRITPQPWLTDDTLSWGSWCYTEDLKIKPVSTVLHALIDIVSKNGCLLLNISPRANGTIPLEQRDVLLKIGAWLTVNGEAIYDTRPWFVFGEGPTRLRKSGHFIEEPQYTAGDFRFTKSKDGRTVYAIQLGRPEAGQQITLKTFALTQAVHYVSLLGSTEKLAWSQDADGLQIKTPVDVPNALAIVYRIHF